MIMALQPNRT